jgi:MFS family permease
VNPIPRRVALFGLVALSLINLLNYLDRFVLSALVESLKHSELALTDFELGLLAAGFLVVYTIAAPFFGTLGDRGIRTRIIAVGAVLWSIATSLSGFAQNFVSLLAARAAVGVGEAAYATVAPSLLADYFPRDRRSRAFAAFYMAIPVGSALGYVFGGLVDKAYGWRAAFMMAGVPGILLAIWLLRLHEPKRGIQDQGEVDAAASTESFWTKIPRFFRNRYYRITVFGYAAYTFAIGAIAFWMPAFLERVHGMPRAQATVGFGAIVVVTGIVGTLLGGWLGDRFLKRTPRAYVLVSAVATLAAVPFATVALSASSPSIYLPAIVVAQLLLFISTSPVNAAIVNAVGAGDRASAVAVAVFTIHALGDVISPPLIGFIADRSSLATAVYLVPAAVFVAALLWFSAARVPD